MAFSSLRDLHAYFPIGRQSRRRRNKRAKAQNLSICFKTLTYCFAILLAIIDLSQRTGQASLGGIYKKWIFLDLEGEIFKLGAPLVGPSKNSAVDIYSGLQL